MGVCFGIYTMYFTLRRGCGNNSLKCTSRVKATTAQAIRLSTARAFTLGLSFKSARRHFGFNRMAQRIARMDKCINEIQTIHECADRIIVTRKHHV